MLNNPNSPDQAADYFNQTKNRLAATNLSGATPITARPISAQPPRPAEDIFAAVDKPATAAVRPAAPETATEAVAEPPATADLPPLRPVANPAPSTLPGSQLPAMPLPSTGNVKYLLIGLLTLVVVLALGSAVYFLVLKPQFQSLQTTEPLVQTPVDTSPPNNAIETIVTAPATPTVDSFATSTQTPSDLAPVNIPVPDSATSSQTAPIIQAANALDSDGDGLNDAEEENLGTNKYNMDSDDDGLSDYEEIKIYLTDPNNPDTDGDTYTDGSEVKNGYNPKGPGRLLIIQ